MDKEKIIAFIQKYYVSFLIALTTFIVGCMIGPSTDELNAANKEINDLNAVLQELEVFTTTLEENTSLTKENDKLVSENEKLEMKLDEATFWLALSDEQKEQIEADIQAEEEAKAAAEAKAKEEAEAKAKEEAEVEQETVSTQTYNDAASTGTTVYITPTGERYHFDPDCGGKNSSATTKDSAISSGHTPCKKCAQ